MAKVEDAVAVIDEPVAAETVIEACAEQIEASEPQPIAEPVTVEAVKLTHWRWVGIRNAKPQNVRNDKPRTNAKPRNNGKSNGGTGKPVAQAAAPQRKAEPTAPSGLALQLAALRDKLGG